MTVLYTNLKNIQMYKYRLISHFFIWSYFAVSNCRCQCFGAVFDFSQTFRGVNTDFLKNFSDIFLISPTSDLSDFLLNCAVRTVYAWFYCWKYRFIIIMLISCHLISGWIPPIHWGSFASCEVFLLHMVQPPGS
jgi:hypothetical protein